AKLRTGPPNLALFRGAALEQMRLPHGERMMGIRGSLDRRQLDALFDRIVSLQPLWKRAAARRGLLRLRFRALVVLGPARCVTGIELPDGVDELGERRGATHGGDMPHTALAARPGCASLALINMMVDDDVAADHDVFGGGGRRHVVLPPNRIDL